MNYNNKTILNFQNNINIIFFSISGITLLLYLELLNFGDIGVFHDWQWIYGQNIFWKAVFTKKIIPWETHTIGITHFFFAQAQMSWMPTNILALFLTHGQIIILNLTIFILISFFYLKKLFILLNASLLQIFVFWILFYFNGYISSHIIMGHISWTSYFLYPAIVYYICLSLQSDDQPLLKNDKLYKNSVKAALITFLGFIDGGIHPMIFFMIGFISISWIDKKIFYICSIYTFFSICIASIKLLPAFLLLTPARQHTGFVSLEQFFQSFIIPYTKDFEHLTNLGWHENSYFIGIIFTGLFLASLAIKNVNQKFNLIFYKILLVCILWTLFSFYDIFSDFTQEKLNFFRIPSRFFIIPFIFIIILICIKLEIIKNKINSFSLIFFKLLMILGFSEIYIYFNNLSVEIMDYQKSKTLFLNVKIIYDTNFIYYKKIVTFASIISIVFSILIFFILSKKTKSKS